MEYKDYYRILGVSRNADEKEIRKTYRKLARQYHPDVNPGDEAAESRFKEINEAYEVLGDKDKRRKYDQLGSSWQQWQQTGGDPRGFNWNQWRTESGQAGRTGGGQSPNPSSFEDILGGRLGGFSDFFEAIFGGVAGARGQDPFRDQGRVSAAEGGQDVEYPLEITLEESYHSGERIMQADGRRLQVKIPAGVRTGSKVRIAGEGGRSVQDGPKGDLYLKIQVRPHPTFERKRNDLYTEVPLDLYTALLGGDVHVPTLDGRVALNIPPETQSGRTFRLQGLGMPNLRSPDRKGNLYVKVRVTLPEQLSEEEESLFRELARLRQD